MADQGWGRVRSLNLLKIAAEAELVRWQAIGKRQGWRVAFALLAVVFLLGLLAMGEVACWQALGWWFTPLSASLMMAGANLVVALGFAVLALRSSPGRDELEALRLRQRALLETRSSLMIASLIPAARVLLSYRRKR
jgi:hypothetical protein